MASRRRSNIALDPHEFPSRLTALRNERYLSTTELAARAGLSERTIRDIEKSKRTRVQEATLLAIARALDVDLDVLLGEDPGPDRSDAPVESAPPAPAPPPPGTPSWSGARLLVPILLVTLALVVGVRGFQSLATATTPLPADTEAAVALVEDRWLEGEARVTTAAAFMHDARAVVAYGMADPEHDVTAFTVRDLETGAIVWTDDVTPRELMDVFGPNRFFELPCHVSEIGLCDLDGDGVPVVVALFNHSPLYPGVVRIYDPDGGVRSSYFNYGHVQDLVIQDLDDDGKDEILLAGTNNAPRYQTGTVILLDDEHARGVSTDADCLPRSDRPDSCAIRLMFPSLPAAVKPHLDGVRLWFRAPRVSVGADGEILIAGQLRVDDFTLPVILDHRLRPVAIDPSDSAVKTAAAWPEPARSFVEPENLKAWLEGCRTFGASRPGTGLVSLDQEPVENL